MNRINEQIPDLVSVDWLFENLEAPNLIVLDATMPKVGGEDLQNQTMQVPGSRFMDLKNNWSKADAPFPNTMLDEAAFQQRARDYGINSDSVIVVYDDHGIYSSPRAWWMFRAMGHDRVSVLDGGLPAWISAGFETEQKNTPYHLRGNFVARLSEGFFVDNGKVLATINDRNYAVLDARAADRFSGEASEPRAGLRSGHIPESKNLPYANLLEGGKMMATQELKRMFDKENAGAERMIFSCGSGITACVLALGASVAGFKQLSVYDGSWTEWGSLGELPIEKS